MHKDTYCPMPFVTLAVNPNNWLTRCMMSNHNMSPITKEGWSNNKFTTLRTDMLRGVWDQDGCKSCWFKETNGQKSRRNRWIEAQESDVDVSALYAPPRPIRSDFGTGRGGNAAYRSALRDYNSLYGT